jgi:hypothetical protein
LPAAFEAALAVGQDQGMGDVALLAIAQQPRLSTRHRPARADGGISAARRARRSTTSIDTTVTRISGIVRQA